MNTHHEPNVKIIENASPKDVRPGDHITWERVEEFGGATIYERREGIAYSGPPSGKWFTEAGVCLTDVAGEDFTVTIRRTVQELPTASCTVIVPADGRKRIEAMANVAWYANEAVLGPDNRWHGVWRADSGLAISSVGPKEITPGTWKVGNR